MKTRVIFVGIHNKGELVPLDRSTKSGKLISRIINELPFSFACERTNLYNVGYFPTKDELYDLEQEWYWTNLPCHDDIIVLLGNYIHRSFPFDDGIILRVAHPASKRSHKDMDKYVKDVTEMIIKKTPVNQNTGKN